MEELKRWFINDKGTLNFTGKIIFAIVVVIITYLIIKLVKKAVERALKLSKVKNEGKLKTMNQIMVKLVYIIGFFIAIVLILDTFGVNTGAILATAGVGGVAIGFGAQYLVRDIISGMVILMEDQFNVGDLVTIDGVTGNVEEVGLRLTKLRDFTGDLHIIQNGNIKVVSNKSRGPQRAWVEIYLPHDTDYMKAHSVMSDAAKEIKERYSMITEGPEILGITDLGEYDMRISIRAMVADGMHLEVEREIRKTVLQKFIDQGIELPKVIAQSGGNDEI